MRAGVVAILAGGLVVSAGASPASAAGGRDAIGGSELLSDNLAGSQNATLPAVAYDDDDDELFVVWSGNDSGAIAPGIAASEYEVFGQRIDGATGEELGGERLISAIAGFGSDAYQASSVAVAYDGSLGLYLVVWAADDIADGQLNGESEIFGRRVESATGFGIGPSFRISDNSPVGESSYDQGDVDVAWGSGQEEFLVVWTGDSPANDEEFEIWARFVDGADGSSPAGSIRLSDNGPAMDGELFGAIRPAVAYNPDADEFLVVWSAEDDGTLVPGAVEGETEIYAQRVDAATRAQLGTELRVSELSGVGNATYDQRDPDVVYNAVRGEYLVVWYGDYFAAFGAQVDDEFEVFARRLAGDDATPLGFDRQLSDNGPVANGQSYDALSPQVAHDPVEDVYLVTWWGDDDGRLVAGLIDDEYEIWAQPLSGDGEEQGLEQRLSDNSGIGATNAQGFPALAYAAGLRGSYVAWAGKAGSGPPPPLEVFGRVWETAIFRDGFESEDTGAWSSVVPVR